MIIGLYLMVCPSYAQIKVVDMIPCYKSDETGQDDEPNLAVNPAHPLQMVGTAFTPNTNTNPDSFLHYSPLYVSSNGGDSWEYRYVIPSNMDYIGTADITLRFAGLSNQLYVGALFADGSWYAFHLLRVKDFNSTDAATELFSRDNVDQPYIQATSVVGAGLESADRVYVGDNDNNPTDRNPVLNRAMVDFSPDALEAVPPPMDTSQIDKRLTTTPIQSSDESAIRTAVHPSGVIYAVFYRIRHPGVALKEDAVDVIVVRDNHWGITTRTKTKRFEDLKQPSTRAIGQFVADSVLLPVGGLSCPGPSCLGSNRLVGSHLSIAVDPNNAAVVYVAWADSSAETLTAGQFYTLHVKKSIDSGKSWTAPTPELKPIPHAINPALAVNTNGTVAFLYQQLNDGKRWDTHLRRSSNTNTSWSDDTLSTFLEASMPQAAGLLTYLGDYLHLMAVGKDFYGVFSASNDPNRTNATFPKGITYQRRLSSDSTQLIDKNNQRVNPSIDPFFFHVTELGPSEDFYVRDFTESSTNYDEGLEPSTSPRFCITSDVWNRTSNAAGSYNINGPASITPQVGANNFIFSRVRRKSSAAAGSADKTVSLNYYYAVFGTGNNFMPITPTSSSSLVFGAGETDKTTDGLRWTLPAGSGRHVCFAVEISTDKDPFIGTTLNHHAPGWSAGTDLLVINDNNRAQRNQFLNIVPDPPMTYRNQPSTLATTPRTTVYAVVHNPSLENIDMELKPVISPGASVKPIVTVPGTKNKFAVINNDKPITLHNMKPGESRFLQISYPVPPGKSGKTFSITFDQVKNGAVVNSFTILNQYAEVPATINENLAYEAEVFSRVNSLYKAINLPEDLKIIQENNFQKGSASREYQTYLLMDMAQLKSITTQLVSINKDDPFNLTGAVKMLEQQMKSKSTIRTANAHLALLHSIDACLTSLQLEKGNAADILQTVYLQTEILQKINLEKGDSLVMRVLTLSNEFIRQYEQRRISDDTYGPLIKSILPELKTVAAMIATNSKSGNQLMDCLKNVEASIGDPTELQGAHIKFLLLLRDAAK